jgi:DNA-binding MarR family transcriptional regulator
MRSDVVETARGGSVERITHDADARRRFVDLALIGELLLSTLRAAMANCRAYTMSECAKLLGLLRSEDANLRFVAMPLLDLSHVPGEERAQALEALRIDSEPQIREAAVRMTG